MPRDYLLLVHSHNNRRGSSLIRLLLLPPTFYVKVYGEERVCVPIPSLRWSVPFDAPPPPPIPDSQLEEDGTPKKPFVMENISRGQVLFENHCLACHEGTIHIRTNRLVKSLPALQATVGAYHRL